MTEDALERQLDYIAETLTRHEAIMIDPQEFGRLQAEVAAQRRDMDRMAAAMSEMAASVKAMQTQLAEARGGWKTLLMVGGAAATAGAMLTKAIVALTNGAPGL